MPYQYLNVEESSSQSASGRFVDENPVLDDVGSAFRALMETGDELIVQVNTHFPNDHYEFDFISDLAGLERLTHLQGVQRLTGEKGNYLFISGADALVNESHLFVVKLETRQAQGPWRENSVAWIGGPPEDRVVGTIKVDDQKWHAGGISVCGELLAVPVYQASPADDCSILFLNVKDPEAPLRLSGAEIRRPGFKAGAVAVAKLPSNGHFLVAAWSDSDVGPMRFDFYLSDRSDIYGGFDSTKMVTWQKEEPLANGRRGPGFHRYQNIDLLVQKDGSDRERLFIVGTYNTRVTGYGDDRAELFEVEFPDSVFDSTPTLGKPTSFLPVGRPKKFKEADREATFAGAAGCSIDTSRTLRVYRTHRYRSHSFLGLDEFRPEIDTVADGIGEVEDSFLELFTKRDFKGRRLSLRNLAGEDLRSYLLVNTQRGDFDTCASSARFQLPRGMQYDLWSRSQWRGDALGLQGTGGVIEIPDLSRVPRDLALFNGAAAGSPVDFDNQARSSRLANL